MTKMMVIEEPVVRQKVEQSSVQKEEKKIGKKIKREGGGGKSIPSDQTSTLTILYWMGVNQDTIPSLALHHPFRFLLCLSDCTLLGPRYWQIITLRTWEKAALIVSQYATLNVYHHSLSAPLSCSTFITWSIGLINWKRGPEKNSASLFEELVWSSKCNTHDVRSRGQEDHPDWDLNYQESGQNFSKPSLSQRDDPSPARHLPVSIEQIDNSTIRKKES